MPKQGELPPSDVPTDVPRRISRRNPAEASGCGLWFLRLFILPHTLIGVGMIGWLLVNVALVVGGTDTQARVIAKSKTRSGSDGPNYQVEYTYGESDQFRGKAGVSERVYEGIALPEEKHQVEVDFRTPPPTIPVRQIGIGGLRYSLPVTGVWGTLGFSLLFAVFWNGILSVFFYMAWIGPYVGSSLYRTGTVARGKIVAKRIISGRPKRVKLTFEFETESGEKVKGTMSARDATLAQTEAYVGQVVTVLYRPDRPHKNVIYEYGNYRVPDA